MANRIGETSPRTYARIAGVLYLINILAGGIDEAFVRSRLIVSGDSIATAQKIMASQGLFRISIAGDLIMQVTDIPMIMIFYVLLKPVSKNLSLLAMLFNLTQTAILGINKLNLLTTLSLLGSSAYLKAFEPHQLQALGYLYLGLHESGFGIGLIFFGFSCLVTGYLIYKSGYFPRILGIMMAIAGLGYIINSFALILSPAFAGMLFPYILMPALIGELSFCLWLMVKGVNVARWNELVPYGQVP
ncbi:DUF4386 domain-containing protein [Flavitalea flava]